MTLGLVVDGLADPLARIDETRELGFEAVSLAFWEETDGIDWGALADGIAERHLPVSTISVYGNPLAEDEKALRVAHGWEVLIQEARRFGVGVVSGFAGRVLGVPVPQSIEPWKRWFADLADLAAGQNVRLAFETCRMGGNWKAGGWNIAYTPRAWELMEAALPGSWFLEWEPGHAILAHADPLTQIRDWMSRVVHLHGKDGRIDHRALARDGVFGGGETGHYCLPGQGDSDWPSLIEAFRSTGFSGSLDIELPPSGPGKPGANLEELDHSLEFLRNLSKTKTP